MNINFLKNPNHSNYSSSIFDGENDVVLPRSEKTALIFKKTDNRMRIIYLFSSGFFGLVVIIFAFSALENLDTDNIVKLLITISAIFSGPLGFVIGHCFRKEG